MHKTIKKLIQTSFFFGLFINFCFGAIPVEYNPNYKFNNTRKDVAEQLIKLDAANRNGMTIQPSVFQKLNLGFKEIFGFFPQNSDFKVIYEQCLNLSETLGGLTNIGGSNLNTLDSFFSNCFQPLQDIQDQINQKFTMKAAIVATPRNGAAPLSVTFDARTSTDPSNDTIPSNNFFWYYRDTEGQLQTIGRGSIINHTFETEGQYIIHLTVRSANTLDKGIFDGEQSISIDVGPQSAILSVYANGIKMREDFVTRIGSQEAKKGVSFDGSPTLPKGGRKILSHSRSISSPNSQFTFSQDGNGGPGIIKTPLPNNGEYKISLTTRDNENNTLKKDYTLVVSDPVAQIKVLPDQGSTSTSYLFDGGASYSVVSSIKQYRREIYDFNGERIENTQGKTLKKSFKTPGLYKIKLTVVDEIGQNNYDEITINVESSEPIAQYKYEPTNNRKYPSQFIFDASPTSDLDVTNGVDALSYERNFSNNENVSIDQIFNGGKKIIASFNEKGKYTAKLTVKDNFNKIGIIEKEIDIKSALRPTLTITPIATVLGRPQIFIGQSNKQGINYERNLGEGTKRNTQENRITNTYSKVGSYDVTLKISTANEDENEITKSVFIGQKDRPALNLNIKNSSDVSILKSEVCRETINGKTTEYSAYRVERLQSIVLDTTQSTNINGGNDNLQFYFKPKNTEVIKRSQLIQKFDEIGCQYIDVTIEDTSVKKTDTRRFRFKVLNALPTLDNVIISFPQYGNEAGIGFNQNKKTDIFKVKYDPLIVKVNAINAKDPDGLISFYNWYYYNKEDPERILELKATPSSIPYTFFSVPAIPGEFVFGVRMTDSEDGEIRSEDIIGKGPIVFFPPDTKNVDIPLVTLKVGPINGKVGDEIRFEVETKILSNRSDFPSNRTIKYDFDGDGERDLSTKSDIVVYKYKKPGEYAPRAQVIYRGYPGRAIGEKILIRDGIKANLLINQFNDKILIRDISVGAIKNKSLCLDTKVCNSNKNYTKSDFNNVTFSYPKNGKYLLNYKIEDELANVSTFQKIINIDKSSQEKYLHFLSIPESSESGNIINISVGNELENKVVGNILYNGNGDCFIDQDISYDSDNDGNKEQDRDGKCNSEIELVFNPQFSSIIGRIYFEQNKKLLSKDINFGFIDYVNPLPENLKPVYESLNHLIAELDGNNTKIKFLKDQLIILRNGLGDNLEVSATVVTIRSHLENTNPGISDSQKNQLEVILNTLNNQSISAALGGSEYENAKNGILLWFRETVKPDIENIFKQIENNTGDKEGIKNNLNKILEIASKEVESKEMELENLNSIKQETCNIINYYQIQSEECKTTEDTQSIENTTENTSTGIGWTIIKRILIIGGVLGTIFLGLIFIFRLRSNGQENQQ